MPKRRLLLALVSAALGGRWCSSAIRAEQRYGNGDGVFTIAEQTAAGDALYQVARGVQEQTAPGRRVRIGLEVDFWPSSPGGGRWVQVVVRPFDRLTEGPFPTEAAAP